MKNEFNTQKYMKDDLNVFDFKFIGKLDYDNPDHKIIIDDAIMYYIKKNDKEALSNIIKIKNYRIENFINSLVLSQSFDLCDSFFKQAEVVNILYNSKNSDSLRRFFLHIVLYKKNWGLGKEILLDLFALKNISVLIKLHKNMTCGFLLPYGKYYANEIKKLEQEIYNNVSSEEATQFFYVFVRGYTWTYRTLKQEQYIEKYFKIADLDSLYGCFWKLVFFNCETIHGLEFEEALKNHCFVNYNNNLVYAVESRLKECDKIDDYRTSDFIELFIIDYIAAISSFKTYCNLSSSKDYLDYNSEIVYISDENAEFYRYFKSMMGVYPANQADLAGFENLYFDKCSYADLLCCYAYKKIKCPYISAKDTAYTIREILERLISKFDIKDVMNFLHNLYNLHFSSVTDFFENGGYYQFAQAIIKSKNAKYIYDFTKLCLKDLKSEIINDLKKNIIKLKDYYYICEFAIIYQELDLSLLRIILKNGSTEQLCNYVISHYLNLDTNNFNLLLEQILLKKEPEYIYKIAKEIPNIDFNLLKNTMYSLNLKEDNKWLLEFKKLEAFYEDILQYEKLTSASNIGQILLDKSNDFIQNFKIYLVNNIGLNNNYLILNNYKPFFEGCEISLEKANYMDWQYSLLLSEKKHYNIISKIRKIAKIYD